MTACVPHNLPAEPDRFVGRERDVAELCALVGDVRVITLSGVGGVGKTRLSLRVAANVAPLFADGVWLVELARLTGPAMLVNELAAVLGVREEIPGRLLDGLRVRLRASRALLVLDNCEHLVESCAELVSELLDGCPWLRFLITSREPLRIPGELIWRVPPLELPGEHRPDAESVRLFVERALAAGARGVRDDIGEVERLCRVLDGLPLALELAAAHAGVLSPGRIADRVGLPAACHLTVPARQRPLLAAVEWSHDLLLPKERVLLRRLSVFAGLFDLGLAERVCADGGILRRRELAGLLGGLVGKSLVSHHDAEGRYRLLETIRRYAADRLAEAGEAVSLRARHLRVICEEMELCHAAGSLERRMPWPARFAHLTRGRGLVDDCRIAIEWAAQSCEPVLGLRLARAALAVLAVGGDLGECVGWHERLLSLDLSAVPADLVAVAKAALAYGLEQGDELGRAEKLIVEGVEGQRRHPYTPWLGFTYGVALTVFLRTGQSERALHCLEELEAAAGAHDDLFNLVTVRIAQLDLALSQGRPSRARRRGEEALALAGESGHHWSLARALSRLGVAAEADGDLEAAMSHHAAALSLLEEMDNRVEPARCHARLGRAAAGLGDHAAARRHVAASLELSRRAGRSRGIVRALVALSAVARAEGDLAGAVLAASAAGALRASIGRFGPPGPLQELLTLARAELGEDRLALLWARGAEEPPEEVAGRVLGGGSESALPVPRRLGGEPASAALPVLRYSGLTHREREIAGLVGRGLSNRAIALELAISPATVTGHVAGIMEKLGLHSRAGIAAWAAEHGMDAGRT
ncbi:LuxR C-terminal-related transcriptional regulator [Nonomuraea sp. NPDC046802]|uniref:ATP-binding protein n=1 Tax=Nonomuraea sp. NPDC046802 TaxID=3154919 RepID=UPI0033D8A5FF